MIKDYLFCKIKSQDLGKLVFLDFTRQLQNPLASSLVKTELILPFESSMWIPQLVAGFLFLSCLL